jgi:hypothetical protein
MRIEVVAALALSTGVSFLRTATAAELPKTLNCNYSGHFEPTGDNRAHISGTFGIWEVDTSALIRAPNTPNALSIPILRNDADQLVASNSGTASKGFVVVVIDKIHMLLRVTDIADDGSVTQNRTGDCALRKYVPPIVF